jgi:UDP-N-acetylglucosamine 2-epimerase
MKVLTVFGTRPEAIKMAVLLQRLNESSFFHSLRVTGQSNCVHAPVKSLTPVDCRGCGRE